jgi:hypothetical protein
MEIWLGIGDHEVQMDTRGPGLAIALPRASVITYNDETLHPIAYDDQNATFDLAPPDRGECWGNHRTWGYRITLTFEDDQEQFTVDYIVSLCREHDGTWGVCVYPEGGSGMLTVFPEEVSESLEESFDELPPEGWSFTPHVIVGGLKEGASG